jgi:peptidoglycan/LPS O-acetylase OafA/YrhL
MAATNPQEPERDDHDRPTIASARTPARRSRWILIAVGIVLLAVIAVIAYFALYNGNGNGGGYGGGGGGTGGGAYFIVAISADHARRLKNRIPARR